MSNIVWFEVWEKISKSEMQAIEKNTKLVIKENITSACNKTFNWIANGDRYMTSNEEN